MPSMQLMNILTIFLLAKQKAEVFLSDSPAILWLEKVSRQDGVRKLPGVFFISTHQAAHSFSTLGNSHMKASWKRHSEMPAPDEQQLWARWNESLSVMVPAYFSHLHYAKQPSLDPRQHWIFHRYVILHVAEFQKDTAGVWKRTTHQGDM